jgi:hypothetical protein
MENTISPDEEKVQPEQTTTDESVSTDKSVQPAKDTSSKKGQETVNEEDSISIPELPEDLPIEAQEYVKLSLEKAKRQMQSAFTKKTQEVANMRKEIQAKLDVYDQIKDYLPMLEELKKGKVEEPIVPDYDSMSDEEKIQTYVKSLVDESIAPYKERIEKEKLQAVEMESQKQEDEAREYAENVGISFDDYIEKMIELDKANPSKYTWKQLLRLVAGDEIDDRLQDKGKELLIKKLQEKKQSTPIQARSGDPVPKAMSLEEAFRKAKEGI